MTIYDLIKRNDHRFFFTRTISHFRQISEWECAEKRIKNMRPKMKEITVKGI